VSQAETLLTGTEAQIPAVKLQARHGRSMPWPRFCGQNAISLAGQRAHEHCPAVAPGIPLGIPANSWNAGPTSPLRERRVTAANADIGVATPAFFPTITINGLAGFQSIDAAKLFDWESRVWVDWPFASIPIFTGGPQSGAACLRLRAGYDATVANYRQTVLSAFQDVEDQLYASTWLQEEYEKETAALKSARRSVDISMTKYKGA